jgi:hypothetical protein
MGSEKGKWTYTGNVLSLSGRAGAGQTNADGKLVFEYDLQGKHYTMTLYRAPVRMIVGSLRSPLFIQMHGDVFGADAGGSPDLAA